MRLSRVHSTAPSIVLLAFIWCPLVVAEPGPSVTIGSTYLPFENFDDPPPGFADEQVQMRPARITVSLPLVFDQGRTLVIHEASYQFLKASYRDWSEAEPEIDVLHEIQYTCMFQRAFSERWSVFALVTPGIASDLETELASDDFNFQAATVLIRRISERVSLGLGAAWSTQFGDALPLPVLAVEWNNGGNFNARLIVPTQLEFWVRLRNDLLVGFQLDVAGNEYHGDPAIYGVGDPRLKYSRLMFGPSAKFDLTRWVRVDLDVGLVGLHRFEFFDGDDEALSRDLTPGPFLQAEIRLGG